MADKKTKIDGRTLEQFVFLADKYGMDALLEVAREFGTHKANVRIGHGARGAQMEKEHGDAGITQIYLENLEERLQKRYGENTHEFRKLQRMKFPSMGDEIF